MSNINQTILSEGIEIFKFFREKDLKKYNVYVSDYLGNLVIDHRILGFIDHNKNVYLYLTAEKTISPISSQETKDYFQYYFLRKYNSALSGEIALREFFSLMESICRRHKVKHHTFIRIGMRSDKIYLDLCNDKNEAIEIDKEGYRIINNPPVIFLKGDSSTSLPTPIKSNKRAIERLAEFLNCRQDDFPLLICYLVHLFFPENCKGAKAILALEGQAGSAKTTFTQIVQALIDPSESDLLAMPRKEEELRLYAQNQWLLSFDNISFISQAISDKLCRLATTATFSTRKLYTNGERITYKAKRCLIFNGISEYMQREDLIDRCILFYLPEITSKRRYEQDLWKEFESVMPEILGSLLDIVSGVLKILPEIKSTPRFRMADFCRIGLAVEKYMEWRDGKFYDMYERNLSRMAANNLLNNVISNSLIRFLKKQYQNKLPDGFYFEMQPTKLFKTLRDLGAYDVDFANPEFPKSAGVFSKKLVNELATTFRKIGINIEKQKSSVGRLIIITAQKGGVDLSSI